MKKRTRHAYGLSLLLIGAVLLLVSASAVAVKAIGDKKSLEEALDEKLHRRVRKYIEIIDYYETRGNVTYIQDYSLEDEMVYTTEWNYIRTEAIDSANRFHAQMGEAKFSIHAETRYVPSCTLRKEGQGDNATYTLEEDYENLRPISTTVITDEDGDQIILWDSKLVISPVGYFYIGERYRSETSKKYTYDSFGGYNDLSFTDDTDLSNAADELMAEGNRIGWHGEYRYCSWSREFVSMGFSSYESEWNLPFEEDGKEKSTEETGVAEFARTYIFFEDGSAKLQEWRVSVRNLSMIMGGVWILAMVILAFALRPLIAVPAEENESDGTGEGASVDGRGENGDRGLGDARRAKNPSGGAKPPQISDELARELISYIDQSAASMGPNGYLEQMRDAIESHVKEPEEK